ncbi:MAG: hypothetical protein ACKVOU_01115 [Cytophagales bacterium]
MKTQIRNFSAILILVLSFALQSHSQGALYKKLKKYCDKVPLGFAEIPEDRKQSLREIGDYIIAQKRERKKAILTVICTQNSSRSHLGQIWIKTACYYYGIDSIEAFSGGTNASAFNERAISALERVGFQIAKMNVEDPKNPKYTVSIGADLGNFMMYSKKYNDKQNP